MTQGDCIYRSEAELVATRTTESRAEYVHSLQQQHQHQLQKQKEQQQEEQQNQEDEEQQQQYRVNSVDVSSTTTSDAQRVFSGDWQNPVTALPKAPINPVVPLHPLLVPLSVAAGHYDKEVDGIWLNSSIDNTHVNSSTSNAAASGTKAKSTINEAAAGKNDLADVSNRNQRESEQQKNEFFDPLLRPPPKVQTPWSAALMVLVPLMLGISTVNREYLEVSYLNVFYCYFYTYTVVTVVQGSLHAFVMYHSAHFVQMMSLTWSLRFANCQPSNRK